MLIFPPFNMSFSQKRSSLVTRSAQISALCPIHFNADLEEACPYYQFLCILSSIITFVELSLFRFNQVSVSVLIFSIKDLLLKMPL